MKEEDKDRNMSVMMTSKLSSDFTNLGRDYFLIETKNMKVPHYKNSEKNLPYEYNPSVYC